MAVLGYHYHLWETPGYVPQADSFLDRMGLYGVSLFYLLSGFTLARVYAKSDWQKASTWISFFERRIHRILPLLVVVTCLSAFLSGRFYPISQWILNLTGLFGYLDRDAYMATGAWSIGNEMVFYGLFPVLIYFQWPRRKILISIVWICLWLIVPFFYLSENVSLPEQWNAYIHPLYQAMFFVGGMILSWWPGLTSKGSFVLILLAVGLMVWFPVTGGHIQLVVGIPKVLLGTACLLLVLAASKLPDCPWQPLHRILHTMGDWSYGIYLWHPLVYIVISGIEKKVGLDFGAIKLVLFLVTVLVVSSISYVVFEKRWVQWTKSKRSQALNNS